jgi:hypothetical protein
VCMSSVLRIGRISPMQPIQRVGILSPWISDPLLN